MLLARKGFRVLLVDRVRFPRDTLSTHLLHPRGLSYLNRWGLAGRLLATGMPTWDRHSATMQGISISGAPTKEMIENRLASAHGWTAEETREATVIRYSAPRRMVLDQLLVDAAREAGATVREGFTVQDLWWQDGRVAGIWGRNRRGPRIQERATVVVGADGRHSLVASIVKPREYRHRPDCTYCYYSYWSDVDTSGLVYPGVFVRDRVGVGSAYTHDGLVCLFVFGPREQFTQFRRDIDGNVHRTLDYVAPELAERIRAGRRVHRYLGTADQAGRFRTPHGPGWALVGDAGCHQDQVTGNAMGYAFRDAEYLSEAIAAGLSGRADLDSELLRYEQRRNADTFDFYDHVGRIAECKPIAPAGLRLFRALRDSQADQDAYFAVQGNTLPVSQFYAPDNLARIVGRSAEGGDDR
jgi:flavin-dependent dehydrogenase